MWRIRWRSDLRHEPLVLTPAAIVGLVELVASDHMFDPHQPDTQTSWTLNLVWHYIPNI